MSGWGMGWFGGGAAAAPQKKKDAPKNAILGLRSTMEMLNKREKHLQNQMEEQDGLARKFISTNKPAAKAALRRKKTMEHSLEQTQNQIMTVEREISSIETANINKETMEAMKNAGLALKQIHGNLTVDKVDQTMADLEDQHAIGEEIANALSEGALNSGRMDEGELEDELEALQQEELDNKMMDTGTIPQDRVQSLPSAARGELTKGKAPSRQEEEDEEEEELRKMRAEMQLAN